MDCKAFSLVLLSMLSFSTISLSQQATPISFSDSKIANAEIPVKMINPIPKSNSLYAKSSSRKSSFLKSLEFGTNISTNISIKGDGRTDTIGNNVIYRVLIKSPGALCLGLKVGLSGAKSFNDGSIFVYTPDRSFVASTIAKITSQNTVLLPLIPGDEAIVEVAQPLKSRAEIAIEEVTHGDKATSYKDAYMKGLSQSCNVDVACPEGSAWVFEKNAVVKIAISVSEGIRLCSGVLVNNTARNKHPYILTAQHCITNNTEAQNSIFYFGNERTACGTGTILDGKSISGSNLIASGYQAHLDFSLVELTSDIPENYQPYYAGWDVRKNPVDKPLAVDIHHPNGDIKKISLYYGTPIVGDYSADLDPSTSFDKNTHWRIPKWDVGTTEGGSSGSALFNHNHMVIGNLSGGLATCQNSIDDYFSMINAAWDSYSDNNYQLKHWLDPLNLGDSTCTGMSQTDLPIILSLNRSYPCTGDTVILSVTAQEPNFTLTGFEADNITSITQNGSYKLVWSTSGDKNAKLFINNSLAGETYLTTVNSYPAKPSISREGRTLTTSSTAINTWYINDKVLSSTSANSISIDSPGAYYLTASNEYGCALKSDIITVSFTDKITSDNLTVYPVPVTKGSVTIKTASLIDGNLTISIYSSSGKILSTETISNPLDIFDYTLPGSVRNGVYIMEFRTKASRTAKKIVVL